MNIQKLLIEPTDDTRIQFFRSLFVGGAATVADMAVLFALTHFGKVHYLISAGISFILGLTVNYILSTMWVFTTQKKLNSRTLEFTFFGIIGLVGLGFNELFMWLFTSMAGLHYLVSKLVATVLVYFWNFFARKYLLFH